MNSTASLQPKAQRRFLHPRPRERRRRLQHSPGETTRRHRPVYITTSWSVHLTTSINQFALFPPKKYIGWSARASVFAGENEDEKLNELMYEAWRINRDCKLLRDGLQGLSWDGQYLFSSLPFVSFFSKPQSSFGKSCVEITFYLGVILSLHICQNQHSFAALRKHLLRDVLRVVNVSFLRRTIFLW